MLETVRVIGLGGHYSAADVIDRRDLTAGRVLIMERRATARGRHGADQSVGKIAPRRLPVERIRGLDYLIVFVVIVARRLTAAVGVRGLVAGVVIGVCLGGRVRSRPLLQEPGGEVFVRVRVVERILHGE